MKKKIICISIASILFLCFTGILVIHIIYIELYRDSHKDHRKMLWVHSSMSNISRNMVGMDLFTYKKKHGYFPIHNVIKENDKKIYSLPKEINLFKQEYEIQYVSNGKWYLLIWKGEDGYYYQEEINAIANNIDNMTTSTLIAAVKTMQYDPTNGTNSHGDFILSSDNINIDFFYVIEYLHKN